METPILPDMLKINQCEIKGKDNIINAFNEHFTKAAAIITSHLPVSKKPVIPESVISSSCFDFSIITPYQVYKALSKLDIKKSTGPDKIESFFPKAAASVIASPIASIFNLSLISVEIPSSWKSAMVLPLLKSGDPSIPDNYRPISRLSVTAKIFESLVN